MRSGKIGLRQAGGPSPARSGVAVAFGQSTDFGAGPFSRVLVDAKVTMSMVGRTGNRGTVISRTAAIGGGEPRSGPSPSLSDACERKNPERCKHGRDVENRRIHGRSCGSLGVFGAGSTLLQFDR